MPINFDAGSNLADLGRARRVSLPAGGQAAVTGKVTARRFALASSATATVVGSLVVNLAAAYPLWLASSTS